MASAVVEKANVAVTVVVDLPMVMVKVVLMLVEKKDMYFLSQPPNIHRNGLSHYGLPPS